MLMVLYVHVSGFSMLENKPEICVFCYEEADFCSVQCCTILMLVDVVTDALFCHVSTLRKS